MKLAPILLFTYNRLEHTKQTIEALKLNSLASKSKLIIYSDGAKRGDEHKVNKLREYLDTINGFKTIKIIKRNRNWGLANNIIDGVTNTLKKYNKVIVLEDDIIVSPFFLDFLNDALELYKNDYKVKHISAFSDDVNIDTNETTYFHQYPSCWGWATWSNRWKSFEPDPFIIYQKLQEQNLLNKFDINNSGMVLSQLEANIEGKIYSWLIKWAGTIYLQNGICLHPKISLTKNIGFDGSGVHCNTIDKFAKQKIQLKKIQLKKIALRIEPKHLNTISDYHKNNKPNFIKLKKTIRTQQSKLKTLYNKTIQKLYKIYLRFLPMFILKQMLDKKQGLIVLMYHSISNRDFFYSVTKDNFLKQMQLLKKYNNINLDTLNNFDNTRLNFLITFDDGYKDNYKILNQLNIPTVSFITYNYAKLNYKSYINKKELLNFKSTIASHSLSHSSLLTLKHNDIEYELSKSQKKLTKLIKKNISAIAYPYGDNNFHIQNLTKKYYDFGFLAHQTNQDIVNQYAIPRLSIDKSNQNLKEFIINLLIIKPIQKIT